VAHDLRDQVIDFVNRWQEKTGVATGRFIEWLSLPRSKFYDWRERYGKVNEHNAWIPRDHWLEAWEERAIEEYAGRHREDGYRRMTFMMLDENVVAVSPSSVYRVLKAAGLLRAWNGKASKKGTGFIQPVGPHEHWHTDVSYLNIAGTFYYLCSVLDGYSRSVVHGEIRESMKEADVAIVLQRAREKHPSAKPRVISDNGPQFLAREFKEFIRISGMDHVRTSPFYPQSNGKEERWHQTLKRECIRPRCPLSLEEARRVVGTFVEHYNTRRLHSAIGYVTPQAKLEGREQQIFEERDRKLETARQHRAQKRAQDRVALLAVPA
jgi:putative transposase